jgi:cytoskeleton protein RodZ
MSSVGTYLRELRQRRGVSLEEIARTTRVAQRYLESLESDAFEALPSPVFTRGFIRAYCQALGEPPDAALAAYEARETSEPREPQPPVAARQISASSRAVDTEPRGRGAVLVSFVLLVVLGVALFAVALVIHPRDRGERVTDVRPEPRAETRPVPVQPPSEPVPTASVPVVPRPTPVAPLPSGAPASPGATAPSTSAAPAPTLPRPAPVTPGAPAAPPASAPPSAAAPAPTPPRPAPATPGAPAAPSAPAVPGASPPSGAATPPVTVVTPSAVAPILEGLAGAITSPYRLVARTSETTWIRVRTEDGRMSEENVPPGEVREWISNRPFTLTIGNAGGVSFELNGRTLPPLGPKGAVIQRIVLPPESR